MQKKLNELGYELIENLRIRDLKKGDLVAYINDCDQIEIGDVDRRVIPDAVLVKWRDDPYKSTESDFTLYRSIFPIRAKEKMESIDQLILEAEEALRVLLEKKRKETEDSQLNRIYDVSLTGNQISVLYDITRRIAGCPKTSPRKYTDEVGTELLYIITENKIPYKHLETSEDYSTIHFIEKEAKS